ncbi:MAG: MBOAT family protein [Candidatus Hydrogenedentes bacterium]|nr:MBOAT family protein [Candidatus Hydrogenedentota bacterium]
MLFNSLEFVVFFPIVAALYFAFPYRFRWMLLLAASYYFYMCWEPRYLILILVSTLIDYGAGFMMGRTQEKSRRVKYLLLSLAGNLGLLFFFKYFNFLNDSLRALFGYFGAEYSVPQSDFLLPVGISFYTFQTLSYTIEVYRGNKEPEKHLGIFALYVAFFPQLVAGPIERAQNLLPQFFKRYDFDYDRVANGLKLVLWGMFKKVVIADRLAHIVDAVYGAPGQHEGAAIVLATVCFAYQIYCDFSGYSDIAIGCAEVMGFRLMKNFDRPYFARSVPEFWRRWHISLSTWFRDYVYISLGGNRCSAPRWLFNLFIVFLVSGLWHGANWTFVVWGALHGAFVVASQLSGRWRQGAAERMGLTAVPRLHRVLQVLATFCLVCFAWIFFRADSMADAVGLVTHLFQGWDHVLSFPGIGVIQVGTLRASREDLILSLLWIAMLQAVHLAQSRGSIREMVARRPLWVRWAAYSALLWLMASVGVFESKEFIYFVF